MTLQTNCQKTVRWKIWTVSHRLIVTGEISVDGMYPLSWNQRDSHGALVSNGYYLWVVEADSIRETRKIILIR
jgi:hypothetical protein